MIVIIPIQYRKYLKIILGFIISVINKIKLNPLRINIPCFPVHLSTVPVIPFVNSHELGRILNVITIEKTIIIKEQRII